MVRHISVCTGYFVTTVCVRCVCCVCTLLHARGTRTQHPDKTPHLELVTTSKGRLIFASVMRYTPWCDKFKKAQFLWHFVPVLYNRYWVCTERQRLWGIRAWRMFFQTHCCIDSQRTADRQTDRYTFTNTHIKHLRLQSQTFRQVRPYSQVWFIKVFRTSSLSSPKTRFQAAADEI